jgi:hypothetical protein
MPSISATVHRVSATTVFSSRRVYAPLAGWAVLIVALFVALLLAVQSGHSPRATTSPAQELVRQDQLPLQSSQFIFRPGKPY